MSGCIPRLAASHSPVFLLNSCLDLFSAPPRVTGEGPFSRSYGANLPSSLTVNLSSALVSSTRPPVSVCGTGRHRLRRRARIFSGVCSPRDYHSPHAARVLSGLARNVSAVPYGYTIQRAIPSARTRFAPPSPLRLDNAGLRNIDRMSIHLSVSGRR